MLSCAVLASCDSDTSEEVQAIIANREANPYQAPVISTGAQVNVNATDGNTYIITFPLNGEAEIEQLGGFFDVEAAFNYDVTRDDAAILTLSLADGLLGDVTSDYLELDDDADPGNANDIDADLSRALELSVQTNAIDADLRSNNAIAQARALNQIYAVADNVQAYFAVDGNGNLFFVEGVLVEITEDRIGRFALAGRQIEILEFEEDPVSNLINEIDIAEIERPTSTFGFFQNFFDSEWTTQVFDNSSVTVFE